MARGNQREKAREKNLKENAGKVSYLTSSLHFLKSSLSKKHKLTIPSRRKTTYVHLYHIHLPKNPIRPARNATRY